MRRTNALVTVPEDVEKLAEQLEQFIQTGHIVEDDRLLPERILTEQLGTSRCKLRHAMAILEHKGLISTVPRSGTYVTINNSGVIGGRGTQEETSNFQLMEARLGLEPVAARLVSQAAGRSELLGIFHAMNLVKQRVDLHVSADDADTNFHLMIVKASHNPYIIGMMMMVEHLIREHYAPFRQQMLRDTRLSHAFLTQHEAIYLAIRQHDADAAAQAAYDHILFSIRAFQGLTTAKKGAT